MTKKLKHSFAVLCAGLVLCVPAVARQSADISVARVGTQDVSLQQLRAMLPELSVQQREALGRNPAALRQAVQAALLQQLLVQSAQQAQWDANPKAAHEMRRAQNAALAESFLLSITTLPETYPQDAELRAYYEANKAQLMLPGQLQLAQIFVAEPQDADRDRQRAAERKRKAISAALKKDSSAENFAKTAREHSDESASAQAGGEIGWLQLAQIVPELRDALQGATAGSVIGPVRLDGGWHWVRCNAVREAQPVALELVRDQLAERMRAERIAASRQAYLERLLRDNPISLNELALIQLVRTDSAATTVEAASVTFNSGTALASQR